MTGLPDLFPGFESHFIDTSDATIFVRKGGSGPPLLLVHGYPQCNVMWHRIAPQLAEHFTLVIPDIRGYGMSSCPPADALNFVYSKRAMANDLVEVMESFGFEDFRVVGHDRGGRVAYRMALDYADKVNRVAVLDIVPTHTMWHDFTVKLAMKTYHWLFLAQPFPLPEMLLEKAPVEFLDYTIASWTKARNLSGFDEQALVHYRHHFSKQEHIRATCEDYRSGQTYDLRADELDREKGNKIRCPLFALWGEAGIPQETDGPLGVWREWGTNVDGGAIDSGHFVAEENPDATLAHLLPFLKK
jgi:haloacetate dehalogenase